MGKMEAIKKKVQAMKVEKDNLCDRCDEVEQKMKEALIRRDKAEEEFTELNMRSKSWPRNPRRPRCWLLRLSSTDSTEEFRSLKKILRLLSRNMFLPSRSMTRLQLLLMTVTEWPRFFKTEPLKMRPNLLVLQMNSRKPKIELKKLTRSMMRHKRRCLRLRASLRLMVRELMSVSTRSLNLRRN